MSCACSSPTPPGTRGSRAAPRHGGGSRHSWGRCRCECPAVSRCVLPARHRRLPTGTSPPCPFAFLSSHDPAAPRGGSSLKAQPLALYLRLLALDTWTRRHSTVTSATVPRLPSNLVWQRLQSLRCNLSPSSRQSTRRRFAQPGRRDSRRDSRRNSHRDSCRNSRRDSRRNSCRDSRCNSCRNSCRHSRRDSRRNSRRNASLLGNGAHAPPARVDCRPTAARRRLRFRQVIFSMEELREAGSDGRPLLTVLQVCPYARSPMSCAAPAMRIVLTPRPLRSPGALLERSLYSPTHHSTHQALYSDE